MKMRKAMASIKKSKKRQYNKICVMRMVLVLVYYYLLWGTRVGYFIGPRLSADCSTILPGAVLQQNAAGVSGLEQSRNFTCILPSHTWLLCRQQLPSKYKRYSSSPQEPLLSSLTLPIVSIASYGLGLMIPYDNKVGFNTHGCLWLKRLLTFDAIDTICRCRVA